MRRLLGGSFFIAAAMYIGLVKPMDIITLLSMVACTGVAILGMSKYYRWTVLAGGLLISISLVMQFSTSYLCLDCIRADVLILCGIIYFSFFSKGKMKAVNAVSSLLLFLIMSFVVILAVPISTAQTGTASHAQVSRYIMLADGSVIDSAEKPVLVFSPHCSACRQAVNELANIDPAGSSWVPVQSGGTREQGKTYLEQLGYRGEFYLAGQWQSATPAFIITSGNKTRLTMSVPKMVETVLEREYANGG